MHTAEMEAVLVTCCFDETRDSRGNETLQPSPSCGSRMARRRGYHALPPDTGGHGRGSQAQRRA